MITKYQKTINLQAGTLTLAYGDFEAQTLKLSEAKAFFLWAGKFFRTGNENTEALMESKTDIEVFKLLSKKTFQYQFGNMFLLKSISDEAKAFLIEKFGECRISSNGKKLNLLNHEAIWVFQNQTFMMAMGLDIVADSFKNRHK